MLRLRKVFLVFSVSIIPLFPFELLLQARYRVGIYSRLNLSSPYGNGLHPANFQRKYSIRHLYPPFNSLRSISFHSDTYGTVEPTSFHLATDSFSPYVLFCGGSTTEDAMLPPPLRTVALLSQGSGLITVNASRSGKDLTGCIKTIHYLLRDTDVRRPSLLVLPTSVNTLSTFAKNATDPRLKLRRSLHYKRLIRYVLPGTYTFLVYLSSMTSPRSLPSGFGPTPYESALAKGCCHGPSTINNHIPSFDWTASVNFRRYKNYLKLASNELKNSLSRLGISPHQTLIVIEANSYRYQYKNHPLGDLRQPLYAYDGRKCDTMKAH